VLFSAPRLDPSCTPWFKQRLELLCPAPRSPLRAGAETAAEFVSELFEDGDHGTAFEEYLQSKEPRALFVILTSSRQFKITTAVAKPGSYVTLMYFLRPSDCEAVKWSVTTLSRKLQVCTCTQVPARHVEFSCKRRFLDYESDISSR
jgi:hypothetical protein